MAGLTELSELIRGMNPTLNEGEYVFATVKDMHGIERRSTLFEFEEAEGTSLILERKVADELKIDYQFIAAWITLRVHSSLEAVGLSAVISGELAKHEISCNLVAAYYHDHLFVAQADAGKAMQVLSELTKRQAG